MKKPTCTFSYGRLCPPYNVHIGFFHSYLKETKKINNQFLTKMYFIYRRQQKVIFRGSYFTVHMSHFTVHTSQFKVHTWHFTFLYFPVHTSDFTFHTSQFTCQSTVHTSQFIVHTSHSYFTVHMSQFTLHSSYFKSSQFIIHFHTSHFTLHGWLSRAMVLGSFQCRGILLLRHMVGQGPAMLAAGAWSVGCLIFFFRLIYPIFLF